MLCSDSSFFTELWNFRLPFSVFLYYHKHLKVEIMGDIEKYVDGKWEEPID